MRFMPLLTIVMIACTPCLASVETQSSESAQAASELTRLMTEQKLDAVAARDPEDPKRFVAALYYPGTQLLVVSAVYPVPERLQERLDGRQFRDVYIDLQSAGAREGKFFVTDLAADGLHAMREKNEPFDIVYSDGVQQRRYDGAWESQNMAESEYRTHFAADDGRYGRMLRALVTALRPLPTSHR